MRSASPHSWRAVPARPANPARMAGKSRIGAALLAVGVLLGIIGLFPDYFTGGSLAGFFWLTRRVIDEMVKRYGGHVVNILATPAEVAGSGAPSALAALAEGGLAAVTRSLAVEFASRGVRVNAVSPGIIQTPVHPADSYEGLGGRLPPLGRIGQVSDVVGAILFLEAAPYITGEILHVDGGQTAGR